VNPFIIAALFEWHFNSLMLTAFAIDFQVSEIFIALQPVAAIQPK
jgi:hypothetical protein